MTQGSNPPVLPDPYAIPTANVERGSDLARPRPPTSRFDVILRAHGWQVFTFLLAVWIVPLGVPFAISPNLSHLADHVIPFVATVIGLEVAYLGWCLAVAATMNARVPHTQRKSLQFPLVSFCVTVAYMILVASRLGANASGPVLLSWIFFGLHLFAMFTNLYLMWFVGRALVAAERLGRSRGARVLWVFLALWFSSIFPIGAWWVQVRARRVAGLAVGS